MTPPTEHDPLFESVTSIHAAYAAKKISPTELTREYLKRAKAEKLNAYLTVCEDRALAQAKVAEASPALASTQLLYGIPLAIKDNLCVDGVRTTCGSKMLETYVSPYTATSVLRLERAGAVALGKANMDEFAMGGSNENSAFGPVKHPTHPEHVPGGSSGGSAAAVGGRLALGALGSDTGGSIRLPASFCGITGLKPTYGRVSRYGLVAFASSLDQIGPLTRSVDDAARIFAAMSGHDPLDSTSAPAPAFDYVAFASGVKGGARPFSGVRIGIPKEYFVGGLQPEVEKAVQDSLKWMEAQGATLVPLSLPHTSYAVAVYYMVAVSEASSNLARFDGVRFGARTALDAAPSAPKDVQDFYRQIRSRFGSEVKRRIILGTFALSAGYSDAYFMRACQVRRLIKNDFDRAFESCDFIAGPVSPTTAFKLGEKSTDPLKMYLNDIFTIPANLAGLPAISVPIRGRVDVKGLPIGLQLQAKPFGEERLLPVAHAFEKGFA